LTLHKTLEYHDLPSLWVCGRQPSTEIAAPAKQSSPHHWKFSKAHTDSRFAHGFQASVHIWLCNKIMQATSISHTKSWKCKCSQHWTRWAPAQEI
jgi:hypothetical protein